MTETNNNADQFEGYELLDTEVESVSLDSEGDIIQGTYDGIDQRKIKDGIAEYLVIKIEGEGLKGIPVNPSLQRAIKKLRPGQHILVVLNELVETKGRQQAFKRYRVYVKQQDSGQQEEGLY